MKIRCYKCRAEMEFPFMECEKCGWEPDGKKRELAENFARRFIKKNGEDHELRMILENAMNGKDELPADWRATNGQEDELKVKCYRCRKEMLFPYIECTECGWIARKKMRRRARELSDMYIEGHKDREDSLRIIWEEENKRLKRK